MSFICNWLELGFAKSFISLKLVVYPRIHSLSNGIAFVNLIASKQNPFDLTMLRTQCCSRNCFKCIYVHLSFLPLIRRLLRIRKSQIEPIAYLYIWHNFAHMFLKSFLETPMNCIIQNENLNRFMHFDGVS